MRRLMFVLGLMLTSATVLMLPTGAGAQTGSLTFDPSTVTVGGGKLFINVSREPNMTATIISQAFFAGQPSVTDFAGVPALSVETSATGTFGIGLTIDPSVSSGAYNVSVRCGGGLAVGMLTVNGLPMMGAPVAKSATLGVVLLAVGAACVWFGRRRARPEFMA